MKANYLIIFCLVFCLTTFTNAGVIIQPSSITSTPASQPADPTPGINGDGVLPDGMLVENGDPIPTVWPLHTKVDGSAGFPTIADAAVRWWSAPTVTLELDSTYTVAGIALWNFCESWNGPYYNNRGFASADIQYSTDGGTNWIPLETMTFTRALEADSVGAEVQAFVSGPVTANAIRLTNVTNHGGNAYGICEIRFFDSLDPAAGNPTPEDEQRHVDPNAEMSWSASGVTSPTFEISIGTDTNCDDVLVDHNTLSVTSYTPTPELLTTDANYYWQIDIHAGGQEYPGSVWSFTTGGKATDPVPQNGQTDVEPVGSLSWTGDDIITSYDVYFSQTGDSLTFINNYNDTSASLEDLAQSIGLVIVDSNTAYQWRVDTRDNGGSLIETGDVWNLTVKEYTCQDIIQLGIKAHSDMNNDCDVNVHDLALLAEQWLFSYDPE